MCMFCMSILKRMYMINKWNVNAELAEQDKWPSHQLDRNTVFSLFNIVIDYLNIFLLNEIKLKLDIIWILDEKLFFKLAWNIEIK